jgi:hypothetical protein
MQRSGLPHWWYSIGLVLVVALLMFGVDRIRSWPLYVVAAAFWLFAVITRRVRP